MQFKPGKVLRGRDLNPTNALADVLRRLQVKRSDSAADPAGNYHTSGQLLVSEENAILELVDYPYSAGGGGGGSGGVKAQVQSWTPTNDYFSAKLATYGGGVWTASGTAFNVALPWDLRAAQSPGGSTPQIYPAYAANAIVDIEATAAGQNGVLVSAVELTYQDLNTGGKAWAQRITYSNSSCQSVHRWVVGGLEIAGA